MQLIRILAVGGLVAMLGASSAWAQKTTPFDFPSTETFYHSAVGGDGFIPAGGESALLSTLGDLIEQNIATWAPDGLSADFTIDNQLGPGAIASFTLAFDGATVPDLVQIWTVTDCGGCGFQPVALDLSFGFPAVKTTSVRLMLWNDVSDGGIAFVDGGHAQLSSFVPEPATWAAMLLGFAIVGTLQRRRREQFISVLA